MSGYGVRTLERPRPRKRMRGTRGIGSPIPSLRYQSGRLQSTDGLLWSMGWAGEATAVTHLAANNGRKKKLDEILDAPTSTTTTTTRIVSPSPLDKRHRGPVQSIYPSKCQVDLDVEPPMTIRRLFRVGLVVQL